MNSLSQPGPEQRFTAAAQVRLGAIARWLLAAGARFDHLNVAALVITAVIGLALRGWGIRPGRMAFPALVPLAANYLGYVHFAVGYWFMACSSARGMARRRRPMTTACRITACVVLALPFGIPRTTPALFALTYMHFAENAAYQAVAASTGEGGDRTFRAGLPLVAILASVWVLGHLAAPQRFNNLQLSVVAGFVFAAWLLWPVGNWRAGFGVLGRSPTMLPLFAAVAFLVSEGRTIFYLWLIWHYVTWVLWIWTERPAARRSLLTTHAVAGIVYGIIFRAALTPGTWMAPLLWPLVSPGAFGVQSALHILLTVRTRRSN